jgi:hypothetical protein
MRRTAAAAFLLSAALATGACDIYLPEDGVPSVVGTYDYQGSVDGSRNYTVRGTLRIRNQWRDQADVDIDWRYLDRGTTVARIQSHRPAIARIDSYGNIRFDFDGDITIDGRRTWFDLRHDGRINRRTISGDWSLRTGLQSRESGPFTARR